MIFPPLADTTPMPEPSLRFGVIGLAHAHIFEMCRGLLAAGSRMAAVYEPVPALRQAFAKAFPGAVFAGTAEEILKDPSVSLIVSADVPARRAMRGVEAMKAGKDFFVDKAPATTLAQTALVRQVCRETGRKFFIFYGESVISAPVLYARDLIRQGAVGRVIHVNGAAPHRLSPATRPDWFFRRADTGGILTDLVCHQIHQFLEFTDADTAVLNAGRCANYAHPETPDWDDFGDCMLTAPGGATGYFRVDWFTPDGLSTWGDSRMTVVGTEGTLELRKNCDLARREDSCNLYLVNREGEFRQNVGNLVPISFYRRLLWDCIRRTDTAINPERALRAIELAIAAQTAALAYRKGEQA